MGRVQQWSEKKIAALQKEGRGQGTGAAYKPWLDVDFISSQGRSRRVFSRKTGRVHHLLSDVEYDVFLMLEWSRSVTDIREQYPLERDVTQDVARQLGVRHPSYVGTHVPTVMTCDFLVNIIRDGQECIEGIDAKRTEEAEDERSLVKLEIVRTTLSLMEAPHRLAFHTDIPKQCVRNIEWIRDSLVKDGEMEPHPGHYAALAGRMTAELVRLPQSDEPLAQYCHSFDTKHGLEPGAGLRVARMLMQERVLIAPLTQSDLQAQPLSSFVATARSGAPRLLRSA